MPAHAAVVTGQKGCDEGHGKVNYRNAPACKNIQNLSSAVNFPHTTKSVFIYIYNHYSYIQLAKLSYV